MELLVKRSIFRVAGICGFVLVFALFVWLDSRLPSLVVRARHVPTPYGHYMLFNFLDQPSDVRVQAAVFHELVHDFTQRGALDVDIPTAAALEYYWEWDETGTLEDSLRVPHFEAGVNDTEVAASVSEIMTRYAGFELPQGEISENEQSYDDGARLAGLVYQQFQGEFGFRYLLLLSALCDHDLARDAVQDGELDGLLLRFRFRTMDYVDVVSNEEFRRDVGQLDAVARAQAEEYISALGETHSFHFAKRRPGVLGAMSSMFED